MKFTPRKEKIQIKKSRNRLKRAIYFLAALIVLAMTGFFIRNYRQVSFNLFQSEKIIRPMVGRPPEQELAEELKKAGFEVNLLSIESEETIYASLSGGTTVVFKTEEIVKQVSSLQLVLSRFKIEGRIPQKIDLRFEKPVVVF